MSYRGIIHSLILMLAVWSPLNNAIAGAAVIGCPMNMSHTLEQGLHRSDAAVQTHQHPVQAHHHARAQATADRCSDCSQAGPTSHAHYAQSGCDTGCHCSFCLLLGASALPGNLGSATAFPTSADFSTIHHAPVSGQRGTPFRPPITRLV